MFVITQLPAKWTDDPVGVAVSAAQAATAGAAAGDPAISPRGGFFFRGGAGGRGAYCPAAAAKGAIDAQAELTQINIGGVSYWICLHDWRSRGFENTAL